MARMLLPLLVFSCVMCLCTTNRLDQLEDRYKKIDEKLAALNTSIAECLGIEQDPATTPDNNVNDDLNSLKKDKGFIKDSIASVTNCVTNMEKEMKTSMQELDNSGKEINEILHALRVSMTSCCQTSKPRHATTPQTTEPSTVTTSTPRPTTTPRTTEPSTVTTSKPRPLTTPRTTEPSTVTTSTPRPTATPRTTEPSTVTTGTPRPTTTPRTTEPSTVTTSKPRPLTTPQTTEPYTVTTSKPRPTTTPRTTEPSTVTTSTPRPTTTPRTTEPSTVTTSTPQSTTTPRTTEPTTVTTTTSLVQPPSCLELYQNGERQSGVYTIYPLPNNQSVQVYCDMDTDGGGWTVFQRRQDGSVDFYRTWADYASGFGNISVEFWLGNDLISSLTSRGHHELRIELKDYDNHSTYARYSPFKVSSSDANYQLKVGGFSGSAGDSLSYSSGRAFSTWDRDNDGAWWNCARRQSGAWWYGACAESNLNGRYGHGHGWRGVTWWHWKRDTPMMWTEMKLRAGKLRHTTTLQTTEPSTATTSTPRPTTTPRTNEPSTVTTSTPRPTTTPRTTEPSTVTTSTPRPTTTPRTTEMTTVTTSTPRPATTPRTTEPSTVTTSTTRPTTTPRTTEMTTLTTMTSPVQPPSCLKLHHNGKRQSGAYTIYPLPNNQSVQVYCDMDTDGGGWTVFQRRQDGSVDFYRTWADYASGFGNISGEFWLGNDLISSLTSRGPHELRIDLKDFDKRSAYAKYNTFKVLPSDANYKLKVGGFSGDAGDSLSHSSGRAFSTRDRDNEGYRYSRYRVNCAQEYGAWWYNGCGVFSNLNGRYGQDRLYSVVYWYHWRRNRDPLKWTEMKLRAKPNA